MKKLLKLIRIVLCALVIFAWYRGMQGFIQFHYAACPELYRTHINALLYVLPLLPTILLLMLPITWLCLRAGFTLHRMHLLFLEVTQPDKLRIRLTKKLGWQIRLLPPRTDGTSPLATYFLARYLCYGGMAVLFLVLTALLWATPASRFTGPLCLIWLLYAVLMPLLPSKANGLDAYLTFRQSRDLCRAWECAQHMTAQMEKGIKLQDMPAEWFLPYPAALQAHPLVRLNNFNRASRLINQDHHLEAYEILRPFFDLTPTPETNLLIAGSILNGTICEALGEDENGAKLPPMCMSQLDHPTLKLPLPPTWEYTRLQAEYARALFMHHDEVEAAALLPKLEAAMTKAGRTREGIEKLQRKAGLLPEEIQ